MIYAVDFDGTLCINGAPNTALFSFLRSVQMRGDIVILWTCRGEKSLGEAVRFCAENGLKFSAINENIPPIVKKFGYNPRKIFADKYIDDKNLIF